jgi:hypothetical protein
MLVPLTSAQHRLYVVLRRSELEEHSLLPSIGRYALPEQFDEAPADIDSAVQQLTRNLRIPECQR